ncbi:MAG: flavodoxin family protein [Candidatus Bipolaricaulaceae bacterium]
MAGKVYVVYASLTGNTRKVAQALAEATGGTLVDVRRDPLPKVGAGDVVFVGDGVYGGQPSRAMRRALSTWDLPKGIKAAVFGTYGGRPGQLAILERILQGKGAQVVDRFSCRGRDWFLLGLVGRGRPSSTDLQAARAFAKKVVG